MKNIIISDNNTHNQQKNKLESTIHYFHELIQKTIISMIDFANFSIYESNPKFIKNSSIK